MQLSPWWLFCFYNSDARTGWPARSRALHLEFVCKYKDRICFEIQTAVMNTPRRCKLSAHFCKPNFRLVVNVNLHPRSLLARHNYPFQPSRHNTISEKRTKQRVSSFTFPSQVGTILFSPFGLQERRIETEANDIKSNSRVSFYEGLSRYVTCLHCY